MGNTKELLHTCLYFTANALSRVITRMAEEEMAVTGLAPSHAFLLMLVIETPGIAQKELAEALHLAPSTVTRFIDELIHRGYLERRTEGRLALIYPTEKGLALEGPIKTAWNALYRRYSGLLGEDPSHGLTAALDEAVEKLENQ